MYVANVGWKLSHGITALEQTYCIKLFNGPHYSIKEKKGITFNLGNGLKLDNTRKYPLRGYILDLLTHTTA